MPRGLSSSALMRPLVVLALPGMYLFYKYSQYRRRQQEQTRRRVTERELQHLHHKIDKLLTKLEENEPEMATSQEDECVICVNAKATMQTSPCGHRVVCRKCFVKTIQMAVSQRLLPLRCVICRAKILRLKQQGGGAGAHVLLPASASQYSMGGAVPPSASLYSMSSGASSLSGVSSVSSATNASTASARSGKSVASVSGASSASAPAGRLAFPPRQPTGSLRRSQAQAMKLRLQEYKQPHGKCRGGEAVAVAAAAGACERPPLRPLPPIREFQREFRAGKERAAASHSTRIRCAQKIVTQLEASPPRVSALARDKDKDKDKGARHDKVRFAEDTKRPADDKATRKADKKAEKKEKEEKKKEEKKEAKAEKKEKKKKEEKESKKEAKAEKKKEKKEAKENKKEKEKKEAKENKKEKE